MYFSELDRVEVAHASGGVGNDDEFVAGGGEVFTDEVFDGVWDGAIGGRGKGQVHGNDAPVEGEFTHHLGAWGEGEDGGVGGALTGGVVCDEAAPGEDDEFGTRDGVGELDSCGDGFLPGIVKERFAVEAGASTFFDARGDLIQNLDALEGVLTGSGFSGEHDGIGLFEHCVGDVSDFRAGWHGGGDHRLEQVGCDDDGFSEPLAAFDDSPLDDWQFFHRTFDSEIASSDHDEIGFANDVVQIPNGELVFDFRNDSSFASVGFEGGAQDIEVGGFSTEREGNEVNADLSTDGNVRQVLLGERWEVDLHTGEVDVAAGAHFALGEDLAEEAFRHALGDAHVDDAIVDQDGVPL